LAKYSLDEEFDFEGKKYEVGIYGLVETFKYLSDIERWTPRKLGMAMASRGLSAMPVGTPEQVADVFEKWFVEGDCDGFNISCESSLPPLSLRVVKCKSRYIESGQLGRCSWVVGPRTAEEGLIWNVYAVPGGTFRENMQAKPGHTLLPDDHSGAELRWDKKEPEAPVVERSRTSGKFEAIVNGIKKDSLTS
jgi:hypothetical protein